MAHAKPGRKNPTIPVPSSQHAILVQLLEPHGLSLTEAMGRIIEWLDGLTRTEQSVIFGTIDPEDELQLLDLVRNRRARAEIQDAISSTDTALRKQPAAQSRKRSGKRGGTESAGRSGNRGA